MPAEQGLLLARQMLRIRVDRDVLAPGRIGQAGGPGVDVVEQPLQEADLLLPVLIATSPYSHLPALFLLTLRLCTYRRCADAVFAHVPIV